LSVGNGAIWDTGWIASDQNLISFSGTALQAFTKYYWRVEITDHLQQKTQSIITSFETGMMNSANWQGSWISDGTNTETKAAPYFRSVFTESKKIKSARAYIAVAGLYEFYINGHRVGDHRLDPMYTRFDKRTLYVAHNVSKFLQPGENVLGVVLGNGWYNHQSTAVWDFHTAAWRNRPAFCIDLRITYEDGTVETITSDKKWKTSAGRIVFNSIYTGEHHDARKEQDGWNRPGFDDSKWKNVFYRQAPSGSIVSQVMDPIRAVEKISVKKLRKLNDTTYVFDFGRNFSGVTAFVINAEPGTVFKLKHGERLHTNGHINMSNIDEHYRPVGKDDPFQTDIYITRGAGLETFEPKFNYKDFNM
jgi:alpha-L-rhamnosidase